MALAVDDIAARYGTDLEASDRNVRAPNYMAPPVRRRSVLVPLLFSGSSGPLGGQNNYYSQN